MIYEMDTTTEQLQSTGGIALAAKLTKKIGLDFSDSVSKQQLCGSASKEYLKVTTVF